MNSSSMPIEYIVLVVDTSKSMNRKDYPPSRIGAARTAATEFVHKKFGVDARDEVAVVGFGSEARRYCSLLPVGANREKLTSVISRLTTSGNTAMGARTMYMRILSEQ